MVQTCTVPCSLFSFHKVSVLRLADNQQWPFPCKLPTNSINPSLAIPLWRILQQFFFSNSFPSAMLPSAIHFPLQQSPSKQFPSANPPPIKKPPFIQKPWVLLKQVVNNGGAKVLREGCDIVTGENCVKQFRKSNWAASRLLPHFCGWGCANLSLQNIE
jgi:hypothetical protein